MIDPTDQVYPDSGEGWRCGITLRTELAKAAMQGILANPVLINPLMYNDGTCRTLLAERAVSYADALITALNK